MEVTLEDVGSIWFAIVRKDNFFYSKSFGTTRREAVLNAVYSYLGKYKNIDKEEVLDLLNMDFEC